MKKYILSLIALVCLTVSAQEILQLNNNSTYKVADIEKIEVINTRPTLPDVLARQGNYSIFSEALEKTGLADTLSIWQTGKAYSTKNLYYEGTVFAGTPMYYPANKLQKFTVFALDDKTFSTYGITDFASLKKKCVEWYGNATEWYAAPNISTGEDYTNTYNVVNMFMRYHILRAGMPVSKLVYEYDLANEYWNFAYGGEPHDYYETLLPHTMMKIWQPLYHNTGLSTNIWINRYRTNNTLTDEIGTFGSEGMHQLVDDGALINRELSDIYAINGYIHKISKPLIYDKQVVYGVLNERMRVDINDMMVEIANSGLKNITEKELYALSNHKNSNVYCIAPNYSDIVKHFSDNVQMIGYSVSAWRAWNASQNWIVFKGTTDNDIYIKLPSVPYSGTYEIRLSYSPYAASTVYQAYIDGKALGEPVDCRINPMEDSSIGWAPVDLGDENTDYGVESDKVMRANGYMRAPASYSRGGYNVIKSPITSLKDFTQSGSVRFEEGYGTITLRKILGNVYLTAGEDHWLRIQPSNKFGDRLGLDYIEIVPESVYNNSTYMEDWY